jgi:hypothetical protein
MIGPGIGIGLAWHVFTGDGVVWHNGATGGYRSWCGFRKDRGWGVALLTNSRPYAADMLGMRLMQIAGGETPRPLRLPALAPPAGAMDEYPGRYGLAPGVVMTIRRDGDTLRAAIDGQPSHRIWPQGGDRFFYRIVPATVEFRRDASGAVTGLVLEQGGTSMVAPALP